MSGAVETAGAVAPGERVISSAEERRVIIASSVGTGLWYPIIVSIMTFLIGGVFVHETNDVKIHAEV